MAQIEKENDKFGFLKGIEQIFLKFKDVGHKSKEKSSVSNASLIIDQENDRFSSQNVKTEEDNLKQYQLLQKKLKVEEEAKIARERLELEDKKNKLSQQADTFVNAGLYDLYFKLIDNGYVPTKKQRNVFVEQVNYHILELSDTVDLNFIENYINMGYNLSSSNTYYLLIQPNFQKKYFNENLFDLSENASVSTEYPKLFQNLKDNLKTDHFKQYLTKKFLGLVNNNNYADIEDYRYDINNIERYPFDFYEIINIPIFLEHMKDIILPNITVDRFINFIGEWAPVSDILKSAFADQNFTIFDVIKKFRNISLDNNMDFVNHTDTILKNTLREYYSQDLNNIIHNAKVLCSEHHVEEKMVKKVQDLSTNYKVNNLPHDTKEIFQSLQKLYDQLENHRKVLTDDQTFMIDKLFDQRIPEILQKYFSIDQEYRESMKNSEGKNAQELMNESLVNFKVKLSDILEHINENKLSDLSVTKRYSKTI